jgi:hypothetical protein
MQRNSTCSRAYPYKCLTFGCLATTGVSNLRLSNDDGIRPNTSQYQELKQSFQELRGEEALPVITMGYERVSRQEGCEPGS